MVRTTRIIPPIRIPPPNPSSPEESALIEASLNREKLRAISVQNLMEDQRKEEQIFKAMFYKAAIREMVPIINMLIQRAKEGDMGAVHEVFDRILGKAIQPITGKDGGPIRITWEDGKFMEQPMLPESASPPSP